MDQLQNNEDEFYDIEDHQLEQLLEPLEQPPLAPLEQPPLAPKKSIKKKHAIKLVPSRPKKFTIKDNEYIDYKRLLFGKIEPDRTDKYCEFYLCNDIQQIKYFTKNIKEYALNTNISKEHITSIVKKINKTKELYFVNPIALIEYANESMDTPKDLIEIVDGHHRLQCLKKLINESQYDDICFTFWVQIYKCENQKDANDLFRKYNTSKPFPINLDLTDLITLIIDKLNNQFSKNKFEFIKNTIQRANRPSICKKEFAEKIKDRLEDQLRTTGNYDYNDISIDNVIIKFINYNDSLLSETLQWFNQKSRSDSGKITENIYKKAKDNKCVLGLLSLEELINVCVCL
jgi:hypothetical protein